MPPEVAADYEDINRRGAYFNDIFLDGDIDGFLPLRFGDSYFSDIFLDGDTDECLSLSASMFFTVM